MKAFDVASGSTHLDFDEQDAKMTSRLPSVLIGRVMSFVPEIGPLVNFSANASEVPLAARSTVRIEDADVGKHVTLVFEGGDPTKPIITGVLLPSSEKGLSGKNALAPEVTLASEDGNRLVLSGKDEVVLECGRASITLTKAGKVMIRGEYVLSRSSGANKIVGGSVQIN